MKSLRRTIAVFAAVCLASVALAADPTGTYTFPSFGRGGGGGGGNNGGTPPSATLVLALKDGKLTGSVSAPGRGGEVTKTEITDASFKDDTVMFTTKTQGGNGERITKYTGKVSADAITGTVLAPGRGGAEPMPRDWVAKKGAAPAAK